MTPLRAVVCFLLAAAVAYGRQAGSRPEGSIEGKVAQDKTGKPVPGAVVALIPESGKPVRVLTAGEDGSHQFTAIAPGEYKLLVWEDVEEEACPPGPAPL